MSQKANLPMKVVKHWFRNTLFKERQRNKDSPYNFNNPPSTTLNLEEYERTGQATVAPLSEDLHLASFNLTMKQDQQKQKLRDIDIQVGVSKLNESNTGHARVDSPIVIDMKTELLDERFESTNVGAHIQQPQCDEEKGKPLVITASGLTPIDHQQEKSIEKPKHTLERVSVGSILQKKKHSQMQPNPVIHQHEQQLQLPQQHINLYNYESKSESGSSDILSRSQSPSISAPVHTHYANISELLNQKLDNLPISQNLNAGNLQGNNMGPPKNFQTSKSFDKNSPSSQFDTNSNSSNASSTSSGKRANRTRFTDYQIKVLQEFFENNSYPKDSDLEYLSKLLLLSPRVIVVWFQNARQKQRKIYENQPNNSLYETEEKKHSINYTCKKCNLAFQRYYELIRHQKNHCFKEENNKKSAKAQIAAAQIAQNLSSEDSNSSMDINSGSTTMQLQQNQHVVNSSAMDLKNSFNTSQYSPGSNTAGNRTVRGNSPPQLIYGKSSISMNDFSPSPSPTPPYQQRDPTDSAEVHLAHKPKLECNICKSQFYYFDHLREHQLLHLVNSDLFYEPFSSILQGFQPVSGINITHHHQNPEQLLQQQNPPPPKKIRNSVVHSTAADVSSTSAGIRFCEPDNLLIPTVSKKKKYDFLFQYFIENENNNDVKQQFQKQQQHPNEPDSEIDFLVNFYNQCELRKRNSYDFLYQYYQKSTRQKHLSTPQLIKDVCAGEDRPHIEFLLQFYHLNESRKFFLLNASNNIKNENTVALTESVVRSTTNTAFNRDERTKSPIGNIESNVTDTNKSKTGNLSSISVEPLDNCNDHNDNVDDDDDNNDNSINSSSIFDFDDIKYRVDDTGHVGPNNQETEKKYYNFCRHTAKPTMKLYIEDILVDTTAKNYTQCITTSSSSLVSQSPFNVSRNATDATASATTKKPDANIYNFNNSLDSSNTHTPIVQEEYNTMVKKQGSADDSGGDVERGMTPSSSPNSNSNRNSIVEDTETESRMVAGIAEKQQNKRLRTTILPDQLNFLYECYQNQSNPSRKMLEEIAKKVNLKKRVVQDL